MQSVIELQRIRVAPFFRDETELRMVFRKMMDDRCEIISRLRGGHFCRVPVAEYAVRIRRRRHHFALMFDVTERAGNRRRVRLVKIFAGMAFQARFVNRRYFTGGCGQKFVEFKKPRLGM